MSFGYNTNFKSVRHLSGINTTSNISNTLNVGGAFKNNINLLSYTTTLSNFRLHDSTDTESGTTFLVPFINISLPRFFLPKPKVGLFFTFTSTGSPQSGSTFLRYLVVQNENVNYTMGGQLNVNANGVTSTLNDQGAMLILHTAKPGSIFSILCVSENIEDTNWIILSETTSNAAFFTVASI